MKGKIKQLEKILNPKKEVDTPIFIFEEEGGLVIAREIIEALGYSTEELPPPEMDGAFHKAGDPTLCLLPKTHELYKVKDGRIELGGSSSIIFDFS
jgi:hypothetical protein